MTTAATVVAKLILDATGYNKGIAEAKNKTNDLTGSSKGVNSLGKAFESLTGVSLGTAGAITAAAMAGKKLIEYLKAAVDETVNYNNSIIDTSRLLGISTEDTSRLVQASDDLFISQEKLNTALLAASRQGIDVSIDGLKKLSDQYLALNPGVERAEFLTKRFGRSGADMGKLMEVGASGIENATSAIQSNLIVTRESARQTIAYKQSVDALQDNMQGLKYEVGNDLMPTLTALNQMMSDLTGQALGEGIDWAGVLSVGLLGPAADYVRRQIIIIENAAHGLTPAMQAWEDSLNAQAESYKRLNPEMAMTAEEIKIMTTANEGFINSLVQLQGTENAYNETLASLYEERTQLEKDLQEARNKGYSEQGSNIKGIVSKMGEVDTQIQKTKDAYAQQTQAMIINMVEQTLAIDGLTGEEANFVLEMMKNNGQIEQSTIDMYNEMIAASEDYVSQYKSMPDESVTITTIYKNVYKTKSITGTGYGGSNQEYLDQYGAYNPIGNAVGGQTVAGSLQRVNESGSPELLSVGNKDYLMMGNESGMVTPISETSKNKTSTTENPLMSKRNDARQAKLIGKEVALAMIQYQVNG